MSDVADPLHRVAGAQLRFLAEPAHPGLARRYQQVLGDELTVARRAVDGAGLQAQSVDLHGLGAVVTHVEQSRLDAGEEIRTPGRSAIRAASGRPSAPASA